MPLLFMYSQTGIAIFDLFYTVCGWALLAVIFAATYLFSKRARSAALLHRLTTPIVLLLAAGLFTTYAFAGPLANPLFKMRFALSQAALTADATRKLATPTSEDPSWVGLFPVVSTEVRDNTVRFITTYCGVIDSCGLVYAPNHAPRRNHRDQFTELAAAWYHVHQAF